MSYPAKAVANYFLARYGKLGNGISPLKLQKLVYVAHGWYMAYHEEPLVGDEFAEAWQYGPVFPSLYHEFKERGNLPIITLASELTAEMKATYPEIPEKDSKTANFLDKIWNVYGSYTGMQLSTMCHRPGSPWSKTREKTNFRKNADIPDDSIRNYYKKRLQINRNKRLEASA